MTSRFPSKNNSTPSYTKEEVQNLPASLEAERFILGTLLVEEHSLWDQVMDIVKPEDFYKNSHKDIFSAMRELYNSGRTGGEGGELLNVSEELKKQQKLETIGGLSYLTSLVEESASPIGTEDCARLIREKAVLRKLIQLCSRFRHKAMVQDFKQLDSFIDSLEQDLFQFTEGLSEQALVSVASLIKTNMNQLEELSHKKLSITGVPTAFHELDHLTSGFQPGEFIVIAARPSMGKTAMSLNMSLAATEAGKKVAFFSIEMTKEQIVMRLLSLIGKVSLSHVRTGRIDSADWDQLVMAASRLSESPLFIDDSSAISPFEIRSRARRLKARHGLDMVVVDYLQLMSLKTSMESREREVSEISRLLKAMAKELELPVVALSQLNRGVEGRSNRRPMLSDLRESGSIEQDADVIMMLYRDDYYNQESENKGEVEVLLNKQRNGPTGKVTLRWNPHYGVFENNIPTAGDVPPPLPPGPSSPSPVPF